MIYLQIFISFFQIGLFSIGGGYAALPLIQSQVVEINHWLSMSEFADLLTISQMTPGPISINAATFVGNRIAGIGGAIIATIGCVIPSCIIVLTLAFLYYKYKNLSTIQGVLSGLRPAIVSLIASAGISILTMALFNTEDLSLERLNFKDINIISIVLIIASLVLLRKFKISPIYVMMTSGIVGVILYSII